MTEIEKLQSDLALAKILIRNAVSYVLQGNPNSYITARNEDWLAHARNLGAYQGPVIGNLLDVVARWDEVLENEEPLLDMPDN